MHDDVSALAGEFTPTEAEAQLALLRQVSRKNAKATAVEKAPPLTVAHLCGNGFCVRPSHLRVLPKTLNEEQTHCHWIQQQHIGDSNLVVLARFLCPHPIKCVYYKYIFG